MKKLGSVNRRPSYWGPSYQTNNRVENPEPPSLITADITMVRADSTEYTADHGSE